MGKKRVFQDPASAQARQAPLALVHTSGLLGEGANTSGSLELRSGDQVLASVPAPLGIAIEFNHTLSFPSRYSTFTMDRTTPGVTSGDVQLVQHVLAPVVESDLDDEIEAIRQLQLLPGTTHQKLMVRFLRLAALMAAERENEIVRDLGAIRSVGGSPVYAFTTGTVNGRVVDLADRVLGQIPVGANIDLPIDPESYPRSGSHNTLGLRGIEWVKNSGFLKTRASFPMFCPA